MVDATVAEQIKESLTEFWDEQSLEVDSDSSSVDDLVAAMDSLSAVDALISVEAIVGTELPAGKVVRRGGYDTKEQFVEDVTARVLEYIEENGT